MAGLYAGVPGWAARPNGGDSEAMRIPDRYLGKDRRRDHGSRGPLRLWRGGVRRKAVNNNSDFIKHESNRTIQEV